MTKSKIPDETAHVRRMAARLRRILAAAPAGVARAELRRRLNSREKYLYDTALGLLLAVGDVVTAPASQGGTIYQLTAAARELGIAPESHIRNPNQDGAEK